MGKSKSIILFCLIITGISLGSEPNDCNEVHSYGYGYESDYNKDCRVDANDLDEITAHWMVDYSPEEPCIPPTPPPRPGPCKKTLYIDGVKYPPASADDPLSMDDDRLTIGSNGNYQNLVAGLYGIIDEFAIYDGILPDHCIAYHASFSQGDANYVVAVIANDPLLYFQFEDAASPNGAPVLNTGSVDRNGTYIGDPCIAQPNLVAGYIGQAVELYGYIDGNTTCVDVDGGDGAFYPEDGNVTIEFWAYIYDANVVEQWYFDHSNGGTETGYGASTIYYGGTDYYMTGLRGGGSTRQIMTYDTNYAEWHHFVITFESEPRGDIIADYYAYVVLEDDPCLCLWLRFDDFNDPCDSSGNDYWIEYGSNTSIGPEGGGIGNCIYFGGGAGSYAAAANQQTEPVAEDINDVNFGHQYGFSPGDTTWEFWFRGRDIPELPTNAVFFNQNWRGDETNVCNSPIFEMADRVMVDGVPSTYTHYPYNQPDCNWGYASQVPAMAIPLDDAWHHIVMSWEEKIYDANRMEMRLCIDGMTVKMTDYPDTSPIPGLVGGDRGEMDHIVIGAGGWRDAQVDGSTLVGYIDEFAIYDGELPIDRVGAHYEAGLPRTCEQLWDGGWVWTYAPWAVAIDKNQDCHIDLYDFADFALEWALCNDPQGGPGCAPNW